MPGMEQLNYQHLLYFWTVAREGTIAAACHYLHVTQSTISNQIKLLEKRLGTRLFQRSGRHLVLTEAGQVVYRYAAEIFALGNELLAAARDRPADRPARFHVGAQDTLPKLLVRLLLEPVFGLPDPVRLVCHEGTLWQLLPKLSVHEVDLVLADAPLDPQIKVRAFSHPLGECGIAFLAVPELAGQLREGFPGSLTTAPALFPASSTPMRGTLDRWFHANNVRPTIVAEFEDAELMMAFGQQGRGFFPIHDIIAPWVMRGYQAELIGVIGEATERFYAISAERQLRHPAVVAITEAARGVLERLASSRAVAAGD